MTTGALWALAQKWGGRLTGLVTLTVLTRSLTPAEFGIAALAIGFISFANVFVDFGVSTYVVQVDELTDEVLDSTFWANLGMGVVLAAGLAGAAPLIGRSFGQPDLVPVLTVLSALLVLSGLTAVQQALLRRRLEFRKLTVRFLVSNVVAATVAVTLALRGAGVWALVAQQLVTAAMGLVLLWRTSTWRPGFKVRRRTLRSVMRYGASVSGTNLAVQVEAQGINLLIGGLLGPTALGYYTVAGRLIGTVLDLSVRVLGAASMPVFARYRHDGAQLAAGYLRAVSLTSVIAAPAAAVLAASAPLSLTLLFGDQWEPAVPVAVIFAVAGVVHAFIYYDRPILLARDRQHWILGLAILDTVTVLLLVWWATGYGVLWVVAARGAVLAVTAFLQATAVVRSSDVDPRPLVSIWCRTLLLSLASGFTALLALAMLRSAGQDDWLALLGTIAAGGLAWSVLLPLLSPSTWDALRHTGSSVGVRLSRRRGRA